MILKLTLRRRLTMSEQIRKILSEAMELPPIERAALVEELLSSFDLPIGKKIDQLWGIEAEDRIDAYERGDLYGRAY
jgi:hypothetical protein